MGERGTWSGWCHVAPAARPMMYKIPEVMVMLRMSRHAIYDQIHWGRLRIVKQGRATFVTAAAVRAYVELLEREAEAGAR
jgi:Helix-turn-helix domain